MKVRQEQVGRCKFCNVYQIDPKVYQEEFVCDICWEERMSEDALTHSPTET